jgi:hypothetical protein
MLKFNFEINQKLKQKRNELALTSGFDCHRENFHHLSLYSEYHLNLMVMRTTINHLRIYLANSNDT